MSQYGCPPTATGELLTICERMRDAQEDFRVRLCRILGLPHDSNEHDIEATAFALMEHYREMVDDGK